MVAEFCLVLPVKETNDIIQIIQATAELELERGLLVIGLGVVIKDRGTTVSIDGTYHVQRHGELISGAQTQIDTGCDRNRVRYDRVEKESANRQERQIPDHTTSGAVVHTVKVCAEFIGGIAITHNRFDCESVAHLPIECQVVVVYVTQVKGVRIAGAFGCSGIIVSEPLIGPGTVICAPAEELLNHAVNRLTK